jgi:hypothetical protein
MRILGKATTATHGDAQLLIRNCSTAAVSMCSYSSIDENSISTRRCDDGENQCIIPYSEYAMQYDDVSLVIKILVISAQQRFRWPKPATARHR